jgi:hypothetical protein
MENLAKALVACMGDIDNVEKNSTVGSGNYSYKGVSDKDVKVTARRAMIKHGLSLIPTGVHNEIHVDRWEEGGRQKQSVFVEVKTTYTLLHISGESMEIAGYGHGMDTADKAAGKATTYALKYALLYLFMIPTGEIDDADKTHSDEMTAPPKNARRTTATPTAKPVPVAKPSLTPEHKHWDLIKKRLQEGTATVLQIEENYILSETVKEQLLEEVTI